MICEYYGGIFPYGSVVCFHLLTSCVDISKKIENVFLTY